MLSTSLSIRPYLGSASNIKAILRAFNGDGGHDRGALPGSGEQPAGEEAEAMLKVPWGGCNLQFRPGDARRRWCIYTRWWIARRAGLPVIQLSTLYRGLENWKTGATLVGDLTSFPSPIGGGKLER